MCVCVCGVGVSGEGERGAGGGEERYPIWDLELRRREREGGSEGVRRGGD